MVNLNSAGVRELRQDASHLLSRVKAGETIEITEHGTPVALLTPIPVSEWERAITAGVLIEAESIKSLKDIKPIKSTLPGTTLDRLLADRAEE